MGKGQKKGFTIIETTLVLSISALLAVGMMIGWSANLNRKRYDDSVISFKTDLESIFDEVQNSNNSRMEKIKCDTSGAVVSLSIDNAGRDRGASDCIMLGKMIVFSGKNFSYAAREDYLVTDIIGKDIDISKDCSGKPCNNSIEAIKATKFTLSLDKNQITDPVTKTLEWGSTYKTITDNREKAGIGRAFSGNFSLPYRLIGDWIDKVALIRSPLDGSVLAFGLDNYSNPMFSLYGTTGVIGTNMTLDWQFARIADSIDERFLITPKHKVSICLRGPLYGNFSNGSTNLGLGDKNKVVHISGSSASSIEIDNMEGSDGSYCDNSSGGIFNGDIVIDGDRV